VSTRRYFHLIAASIALALTCTSGHAQHAYPSRPVKIIVPLAPGAAVDQLARVLAESLRHELKGDFIVENKAGAGGIIGADFVAKAKPDGYTIGLFHSSVLSAAAATNPQLQYHPRTDFTPIAIVASNPIVLAVPSNSRFKTLEDFVQAARKEPGKYSSGFIGVGSHSQFNLELLNMDSGADILRIPYAGGGGALMSGLLGGHVDSASALWAFFAGQVAGGKLRLLATAVPLKDLPEVPTFASKGYKRANMEVLAVVVGPPHMPPEIANQIARAVERFVKTPKNIATLENQGFQVRYGNEQQLADYISEETTLLTNVAKKAGIKVE
jgi:tripartite-type tricarboxylate transporter receptor subunit TctC